MKEIEEMTMEELDEVFMSVVEHHEAEIADLQAKVAELEKENKRWKDVSPDRSNLEYIIALEKQVEDLKCCGNCKNYKYLTKIGCYEKTYFPEDCCNNWQGGTC